MNVLILLGFLACATAAPQYSDGIIESNGIQSLEQQIKEEFGTSCAFCWVRDNIKKDGQRQKEEKIEGRFYKIQIHITGFDEADFKVKACEGACFIQAVHTREHGKQRKYREKTILPYYVDFNNGFWAYKNDFLSIMFPLNQTYSTEALWGSSSEEEEEPSTEGSTEKPTTNAPINDKIVWNSNNSWPNDTGYYSVVDADAVIGMKENDTWINPHTVKIENMLDHACDNVDDKKIKDMCEYAQRLRGRG